MNTAVLDGFLNRQSMMQAEEDLLALNEEALPILEALLNGSAKNGFGVPYRDLGLPLRCALEVARRLGPIAKPLEPLLAAELKADNHVAHVAAMALGSLEHLEEESVAQLTASLTGSLDLSFESAAALIRCGQDHHSLVLRAAAESDQAAATLNHVKKYLLSRPEK